MTGSPDGLGRSSFRFEYDGPTLRAENGVVGDLGTELAEIGVENALLVCGSTVGSTSAVIDPVTAGIGDRLAGVFDETTPDKRLSTALDARDMYRDRGADGFVALGGGSSLDVTKVAATVTADPRPRDEILSEFASTGTVTVPDTVPPVVVVPTTLAGADQSQVAGITADPGDAPVEKPRSGGVSDPAIMPAVACYDPELFATTPPSVLRGSAMNGFDKGIETLYSRFGTPVTDATATAGIEWFSDSLPALGGDNLNSTTLTPIVNGLILVQYGISRPGRSTLSIIHAFGHGLTAYGDLQQGLAHAVMAPQVLEYLFEAVDAEQHRLAAALGVRDATDPGAAVVDRVTAIRDAMDLPTRLRDVDAPPKDRFEDVARATVNDSFMENGPRDLNPSVEDLVEILEAAY